MPSTINLQSKGLNRSPNQLSVPEGSLSEATNVIIKRNDVVESRRGFKLYGDQLGTSTDVASQLFVYQDRILRHFASTLQYDTEQLNSEGQSEFGEFSGTYSEPATGIRVKSVEGNGNFYFNTLDGIKKISANSASDFTTDSGYITDAGGVKALDLDGELDVTLGGTTGFLAQDSTVAYRAVWVNRDLNQNLIIGTPSQRFVIYNSLNTLLIRDFNRVLAALDNLNQSGSIISDGTYVSTLGLSIGATTTSLTTNLVALAAKLDLDIKYADESSPSNYPLNTSAVAVTSNVVTITFSSGDPRLYVSPNASKILISGFTDSAAASLDGHYTVTGATATTLTFTATAPNGAGTVSGTAYVRSYDYTNISTTAIQTQASPQDHDDLVNLQDYLNSIITVLQSYNSYSSALTGVISSALNTAYISSLATTTAVNTIINVTIPENVVLNTHYLQLYRSNQKTATGTDVLSDLAPDDELKQVYEAFPTSSEIYAGIIYVTDIVPDSLAGGFLYTNEISGEGALQGNDLPPYALDINRFKNYTFFANTSTRQRKNITLLGVSNLTNSSRFTIADGTTTNTYSFVTGIAEVTPITVPALAAPIPASGYINLYNAQDLIAYYLWMDTTGSDPDPAVSGKTGIRVNLAENIPGGSAPISTAAHVAVKIRDVLNSYPNDFSATAVGALLTITNANTGVTTNATLGTGMGAAGFSIGSITQGAGEDAANQQVLLSNLTSPSQAVDETARSLVRVINQNDDEIVYAYYLTSIQGIPGVILLEARVLSQDPIYFLTNNAVTGTSFSPDLSPAISSITNTLANPTVVTAASHGLSNLDYVMISGSNSTPSIDGLYQITYLSANTFSIDVNVTIAGTLGAIKAADSSAISDNEAKSNRLYYSKFSQPEAVPLLNYIDIGSENKAIKRIFPLTDSLFVFKEDGLFRVSGEIAPFSRTLFDSSCILIAADSLAVSNNLLYCWTTQGIVSISESGVSIISRPIDVDILKFASANYTNFSTATWGVGYDSDNSYLVGTVQAPNDTVAQIIYRYSTLTNTWTVYDKSNSCGIVNSVNDKLYLGAGDINSLEIERKSFDRTDYADREYSFDLESNSYLSNGSVLELSTIRNIEVGDVVQQEQPIPVYTFNALLHKIDLEPGTDQDYFDDLEISGGDSVRTFMEDLATKLDADPGVDHTVLPTYTNLIASKSGTVANNTGITVANPTVITSAAHGLVDNRVIQIINSDSTPSLNGIWQVNVISANTFTVPVSVTSVGTASNFTWSTVNTDSRDQKACYNATMIKLNADIQLDFNNYSQIVDNTFQEAIVTSIDKPTRQITLNVELPWVIGELIVYKAIDTSFQYCPITMQDPLGSKHLREATIMFEDQTFTNAMVSFGSDLAPSLVDVAITGQGNGLFGNSNFGTGFFGGLGNSAPFRTYIPRNAQRCRFLLMKYEHNIAREKWSIFGISVTGEIGLSTRAYR